MWSLPASGAPAAPSWRFTCTSLAASALAIGVCAWLSQQSGAPWLMAPFGASCVLAFGLPDSPLAQPRALLGGHLITSAVGLLLLAWLGDAWWSQALAVGLALAAMQRARAVHAPAGANPLVVMQAHPGVEFLLTPTLLGALVIVAAAWLVNNRCARGSYPRYWW